MKWHKCYRYSICVSYSTIPASLYCLVTGDIMFYSSSTNTFATEDLLLTFEPSYNMEHHTMPANYTMASPFKLILNTMHMDDPEHTFGFTQITPTGGTYTSLDREHLADALYAARMHKHDYFEFMFVLEGEIYVNIENHRHLYKVGSCCVLNKNVMHKEEYSSDFRIVFLQLSTDLMRVVYNDLGLRYFDVERLAEPSVLMEFMRMNLDNNDLQKDYVDFIPREGQDDLVQTIHGLFDSITRQALSPEQGSSLRIKNQIVQLFTFLSDPANYSTTPIQIGTDAEYLVYTQIVRAMEDSYGRISRSQLSELLCYSGTYLNTISKKYSGLALFDLSMTFCMNEAARRLENTTENITDIGYSLGFTNRTHFYKIFKETYNVTPAEYRRLHRHV